MKKRIMSLVIGICLLLNLFAPVIAIAESLTYQEIEEGVQVKQNLDGSKTMRISAVPEQRQGAMAKRSSAGVDGEESDAEEATERSAVYAALGLRTGKADRGDAQRQTLESLLESVAKEGRGALPEMRERWGM